jgi:hypothetical protein
MSNFVTIKDKDGVTLGELPVSKEGGRLRNVIYMTESGTYEKPAWLKFVIVTGCGGGGGRGGRAAYAAGQASVVGSTGSGAVFQKTIMAGDLLFSEDVTIGVGGAAGASGNTTGGTGGTTSFGAHCSAPGGGGSTGVVGSSPTSAGGAGALVAVGGDLNVAGLDGVETNALVVSGSGAARSVGARAAGFLLSHGSGLNGIASTAGAGSVAVAGAQGLPGIVIIEEYE